MSSHMIVLNATEQVCGLCILVHLSIDRDKLALKHSLLTCKQSPQIKQIKIY